MNVASRSALIGFCSNVSCAASHSRVRSSPLMAGCCWLMSRAQILADYPDLEAVDLEAVRKLWSGLCWSWRGATA